MDSPELKDNPITLDISGNYNIVNIAGNYGIVKNEDSEKEIIENLKKSKEKEVDKKINLLPTIEAEKLLNYREAPKYLEKDFTILLSKLKPTYISLISLSIYIEQCYEGDKKEEAEEYKQDIWERYQDFGLKFNNLWSRGYLKNLFKFLLQNPYIPLLNINDRLSEFIEKAESIFLYTNFNISNTSIYLLNLYQLYLNFLILF